MCVLCGCCGHVWRCKHRSAPTPRVTQVPFMFKASFKLMGADSHFASCFFSFLLRPAIRWRRLLLQLENIKTGALVLFGENDTFTATGTQQLIDGIEGSRKVVSDGSVWACRVPFFFSWPGQKLTTIFCKGFSFLFQSCFGVK